MLAPCSTSRGLEPSTLSSRITSGRAAGIQISQSTPMRSSAVDPLGGRAGPRRSCPPPCRPPAGRYRARRDRTRRPCCRKPRRGARPSSARKRAACRPTAPKPCTTTLAPSKRNAGDLLGDLGRDGQAESGCADLVERDAADLARQSDRAADLVLDPGHGRLVGAHVRARECTPRDCGWRRRRRARAAPCPDCGMDGSPKITDLAPPCAQPCRRILQGHGARQADALLHAHVGGHARAADGRPGGRVVDHDDGLEADAGLVDVNDLLGAQLVCEPEHLLHHGASFLLHGLRPLAVWGPAASPTVALVTRQCNLPLMKTSSVVPREEAPLCARSNAVSAEVVLSLRPVKVVVDRRAASSRKPYSRFSHRGFGSAHRQVIALDQ